jgi:hypothetical protein
MFGLTPRDLPAFLAANGIRDATRVGPGFVYRIANPPARALAEHAVALEAERTRLARELAAASEQVRTLAEDATAARQASAAAEARATRNAQLAFRWPMAMATIVVLVLVAVTTAAFAFAAVRNQRRAERFARTLALELENKRKGGLLERQESARRILELETRVRTVEAQLGPRLLIGGRS